MARFMIHQYRPERLLLVIAKTDARPAQGSA
jgi:hypothetical protein